MNQIVVAPSELAQIWQVNVRTIRDLTTAGIVVKIGPAKYDLLAS
jgi:phage terminase Nu1 subunit (DNA packaging protein)